MKPKKSKIENLIAALDSICEQAKALEQDLSSELSQVDLHYTKSAPNLLHYTALRRHDLRDLQSELGILGVARLDQTESHVMLSIIAVRNTLSRLIQSEERTYDETELFIKEGTKLIRSHTNALLGRTRKGSPIRIMVTLPTEAAEDKNLIHKLVSSGMNVARINCAHDNKDIWKSMIDKIQKARRQTGRTCTICMDLAGPKLRTGPIQSGPKVVHIQPKQDSLGRVTAPCKVWLASPGLLPPAESKIFIPGPAEWIKKVKKGDEVRFTDARGKRCTLKIGGKQAKGSWAECYDSAYIMTGTKFVLYKKNKKTWKKAESTRVLELRPLEQTITLHIGDLLILHKDPIVGQPAEYDVEDNLVRTAHISCTLPEALAQVKADEPILFDDGKIAGIIRSVSEAGLTLEITQAKKKGSKLGSDKGINLPASTVCVKGFTSKDREDLKFIVQYADVVNLSFVNEPQDILNLFDEIEKLNARHMGIILKIETRRGFRNLLDILLTAMRTYPIGVMIARGDLAIECGYERLAEIQEEILWMCEAAHIPVIWATQVLENLAKKGLPTRAEITDAAMGERAECVMLNKGPYIMEAVHLLDDILQRMQTHQGKKKSLLRKLTLADNFRAGPEDASQPSSEVALEETWAALHRSR